MDLNLVRERASALHTGAIQEPEYLQEVRDTYACSR